MLFKKVALYVTYTIAIGIFILSGKAHWVDDPGPDLIEGDENNLTDREFSNGKEWDLSQVFKHGQQKTIVTAQVYHRKENMEMNGIKFQN